MTPPETLDKLGEMKAKADKAMRQHGLALSAFDVACARHDWPLAEKEQQSALSSLADYMDVIQAVYRMQETR